MSAEPGQEGAPPVGYAVESGLATVRLQRPEALNALDVATKVALRDALAAAAADPDVRAVLLTGSGRAFCVGQDLREHAATLQAGADEAWRTVEEHFNPIVSLIAGMPKPVVAAVNGVAAGAGASFAFACDLRVVAESASFTLAFAQVGLSCDSGASWTLPRLVGWARARELLLLGRKVGAQEALALGLATEVVPDAEVGTRAREVALSLAGGPTQAYAAIREALAFSAGHDLEASLAHEGRLMHRTGTTEDHRDAVAAFLAKERPRFRNR